MSHHAVRALAFHHEKGYLAQRKLALDFAGPGGRIATVEDIVHARLGSDRKDNSWSHTVITDSLVYTGKSKSGTPLLVFAHGTGPHPFREEDQGAFRRYEHQDDLWKSFSLRDETFNRLITGGYGDVNVVDLSSYKNPVVRTKGKGMNSYTYEEASRDAIVRAFFGRETEAFLERHEAENRDWTKGIDVGYTSKGLLLVNRLYDLYEHFNGKGYSVGSNVRCLTIEGAHFYLYHETKQPMRGITEFGTATNSGIDDLGGEAYFMVGVRGPEPLTHFARDFRSVVGEVKENWRSFVQPLSEVPNDSFTGIKPDGSKERPYYLLSRWGSEPQCTGRICEDGSGSLVPEYRIKSMRVIDAPPTVEFKDESTFHSGYPYPNMWDACVKAMPTGANAMLFGWAQQGGGKFETSVTYYHVTLDEEPFHILMKCGDALFTQYSNTKRPTGQPHRLVEETFVLEQKVLRIPDEVWHTSDNGRELWPVYGHLMHLAPEGANAMLVTKESVGYREEEGTNVMHASVTYYHVKLADQAFRPFSEIRTDFDWQLDRRLQAKMLDTL